MRRSATFLAFLCITGMVLLAQATVAGSASPAASPSSPATASPSASPVGGTAGKLTYRIGIGEDFDGMNPFASWSTVTWESFRACYNFLTWYDDKYQVAPDLATSWDVSQDGNTWTFHIRPNVKWSDGVPLTARDIAFTYNLILTTQHWSYYQYFTNVTKVEATDANTLVIHTSKPNAGMLALYVPILPEHIWQGVTAKTMETVKNVPMVSSGPFHVAQVKKGSFVRLEKNLYYGQGFGADQEPAVDEILFEITTNVDSMLQDFKAGRLDAILAIPASYVSRLKNEPGTTAVATPAIGFNELVFNCYDSPKSKGNPLLLDVRIRQAVNWAIDKNRIVQSAMAGMADVGTSLLSPVQAYWHWNVPADQQYGYDPEKAKQILDDAGYIDRDGDGVREDAKGHKLDFRLASLTEYPEYGTACKIIASYLKDVGIATRIQLQTEGSFGDAVYDNANMDLYVWGWGGDIDPGFMLSCFTTKQILNWSDCCYSNPEYDKLYNEQASAVDIQNPTDMSKRQGIVDQMQAILYRDSPYSILWYNMNLQAFRTDRWTGYDYVPKSNGAPFQNYMRTTYIDLKPKMGGAASSGGPLWWTWVIAVVVVLAVVVVVVLRRRAGRAEVE